MYSFDNIRGNDQIKKRLSSAIANKRISHSYIILGNEGMGKKLLANTFAKAIQCESQGSAPCGNCASCRVFESGNHPDVLYVYPEKTKDIGASDIRSQILSNLYIKPYKYKYKVFILENADNMSPQAQNALLKTLEEPPSYAVFLLLGQNINGFLPTVKSRCITFKLRPVSYDIVADELMKTLSLDKETAYVFAEYSGGNIGYGLKLAADDDFSKMRDFLTELAVKIKSLGIHELFQASKDLGKYKTREFLDILYLWYRDLMVIKSCNLKDRVIQKDKLPLLLNQAETETLLSLRKKTDALFYARKKLNENANFELNMDILLLKIKES